MGEPVPGAVAGRDCRSNEKTPRVPVEGSSRGLLSGGCLLADAEALDRRAVAVDVGALEVVEEAAALAHHAQESPARVVVLHVRLEVLGEAVDVLGEEGDLHFRRPGVALRTLEFGNDARLVGGGYGHCSILLGDSPAIVLRSRGKAGF